MRHLFIFFIFIFVFDAVEADERSLNEKILGTWIQSKSQDGEIFYQESTYLSDGRKCSYAFTKNASGELDIDFYLSHWFIDKTNRVTAEVGLSSSEYVLKEEKFIDMITELTESKLVIEMVEPFKDLPDIYFKSPYEKGQEICDLVEKNT